MGSESTDRQANYLRVAAVNKYPELAAHGIPQKDAIAALNHDSMALATFAQ
jgi:hypothetical protein